MGNERGAAPTANGVRVLVLDEDRVEGGMLAFHLRREGLIVMLMTSLDEMRDALAWAAPDVLLVDLTSRGFDARELFAVLRAAEDTCKFDIVAFADRALDAELELEALRHGVVDVLTKPLDARALAERVKQRAPGMRRPRDLGMPVPDGAIGGDLTVMPPLKVLELCLRHRLNARLHVPIEGDWAVVVVRQGDVIDAETATTTGRTAAISALRATTGVFVLLPLPSDADELRRDDVVRMDLATLAAEALGRAAAPPKPRGLERAPLPTAPPGQFAYPTGPSQHSPPPSVPTYAPVVPVPAAPAYAQPPMSPQAAAAFTPSRSFQPVRPAAQIDSAAHELPRVVRRDPPTAPKAAPAPVSPPMAASDAGDARETIFDDIPTDQKQHARRQPGPPPTAHTTPTGPVPRRQTAPGFGLKRTHSQRMSVVTSSAKPQDAVATLPPPARARAADAPDDEDERDDQLDARRRDDRADHARDDARARGRGSGRAEDPAEVTTLARGWSGRTRLIVMAAAALAFTVFGAWQLATKGGGGGAAPDGELRLGQALRDLDAGKREEARRALIALAADPSPDATVLAALARIHIEDHRWIEAQALLETLAERFAGDPRVWAWLGIVSAERGEKERAVEAFVKAQNAGASRPLSEKLARLMAGPKSPSSNP